MWKWEMVPFAMLKSSSKFIIICKEYVSDLPRKEAVFVLSYSMHSAYCKSQADVRGSKARTNTVRIVSLMEVIGATILVH